MVLCLKRLIDVAAATLLLLVLSPLLVLLALLVKFTSPGPVFYVQERVGHHGRRFKMLKLRTMVDGADRFGNRVHQQDPRITPLGKWLRRFSLDELPQLWHVLTGQMSLVGPRPAPPAVAGRFTTGEQRRHSMRPGLTGWAQVQGRNSLRWPERIRLDLWYIEHWSLWLDCLILFRTAGVVFRGAGLYGRDGWNRGYS